MRLLLALTLLATALAGCNGTTADPFCSSPPTGSDVQVPPTDDAGAYVIVMTSAFRFHPENAEVPVGATVLWKNCSGVHNVKPADGAWQEGPVSADDFSLVVTEAMLGDHAYVCVPHEGLGMKGTLHVVNGTA